MPNPHFLRERLPPPRSFYENELGRLGRQSRKGEVNTRCPFHVSNSRSKPFSVNLITGRFHCFSCQAGGGGVVDYVMLRDRCDFTTACQILGAWDGYPSAEAVKTAKAADVEGKRKRAIEAAQALELHDQLIELRDELHLTAQIMREASDRLSELRQGAAAVTPTEEEAAWAVMALALEDLRLCDAAYCEAAGLEFQHA